MNNKQNMNPINQTFNTHSFGVDYIYGRHGSQFPTGELKELIFITNIPRTHQKYTKPNGKCLHTGKVNSIDNQPLIYQNIGNNRQKTGKTRNDKQTQYNH